MEVSVVQFESREQGGEPSLREIEEGASMTILLLVVLSLMYLMFQYRSGKLSREKTCEFRGFVAICKSFLCKIWGHGILWRGTSKQLVKVFSVKSYFSPIRESFLPQKFPTIQ